MSKSNKILNYAAMACAIMATIAFCINKDWDAALWAMIAFIWMVDCHLTEDSYYDYKESSDKWMNYYFDLLNQHEKKVKELKDEIEKLNKK